MTLVIAHRGASRAEHENTLSAFVRAGAMGADGVELDARLTADGHLVVHHDPFLSDGRVITAVNRDELPEYVPTLEAALEACAGMFVNIEIKNDPGEPDFDPDEGVAHRVAELLQAWGANKRWLISSFRAETIALCRTLLPEVRTGWLVERCSFEDIALASQAQHDAIHPKVRHLSREYVRAAHAVGLAVNTWTCNDADRLAELMAWGVDGVCTDVPDVAVDVRARIDPDSSRERR